MNAKQPEVTVDEPLPSLSKSQERKMRKRELKQRLAGNVIVPQHTAANNSHAETDAYTRWAKTEGKFVRDSSRAAFRQLPDYRERVEQMKRFHQEKVRKATQRA